MDNSKIAPGQENTNGVLHADDSPSPSAEELLTHDPTETSTVTSTTSDLEESFGLRMTFCTSIAPNINGNGNSQMKPTLGYWKIRGLVQPVRFILAYTGTEYDQKYYEIGPDLSRESWLKEKFTLGLEFPNLPYWIEGDEIKLTQSRAILRHIARDKAPALLGKTSREQRQIDMLENHMWDCWMGLVLTCFHYTEQEKANFLHTLPGQLELLSNFIGENTWSVGDSLTYVDFMIYEALYQHRVFSSNCLHAFPRLETFLTQFEALPAIAEYMKSPDYIEAPLYTRLAKHYI